MFLQLPSDVKYAAANAIHHIRVRAGLANWHAVQKDDNMYNATDGEAGQTRKRDTNFFGETTR